MGRLGCRGMSVECVPFPTEAPASAASSSAVAVPEEALLPAAASLPVDCLELKPHTEIGPSPARSAESSFRIAGARPGRGAATTSSSAILVLGGAFSPVHCGHLAAMEAARKHVEARSGLKVVAGYLACAPSRYCTMKYGQRAIPERARLDMCNLLAQTSDSFLHATPQAFGSARACADFMIKNGYHTPDTRVIIVCGADKAEKRLKPDHLYIARTGEGITAANREALVPAPGETLGVSATLLRRELGRQPLEAALDHAVEADMLPRCVASYIAAHSGIFEGKFCSEDGRDDQKKLSRKQVPKRR